MRSKGDQAALATSPAVLERLPFWLRCVLDLRRGGRCDSARVMTQRYDIVYDHLLDQVPLFILGDKRGNVEKALLVRRRATSAAAQQFALSLVSALTSCPGLG